MKFICNRDDLLKELNNARDFAAQKNALSILSNVYLNLNEDNLTIKTTDQKTGYKSVFTVQGIEGGEITVPCDKFTDILKTLPSANIVFERSEEEEKFSIKPENSAIEFSLRVMDASSFPVVEMPSDESYFKISRKNFTEMINQVIFAVSDDESKFAMTGALLERTEDSLIMVATDGRRLSYINRKLEENLPEFNNVIIPAKFLEMIRKRSDNEGDFEISVTSTSIFVKINNYVIFSNLINNEFPAYKRVIPNNQTKTCVIEKDVLESALKRVSLLVENKFKKVKFAFFNNKLMISTEDSDIGSGKETIDCEYFGDDLQSAMNFSYILGPLKAINSKKIKFSFTEGNRPFTLTSEPEEDFLHVIMPMNLV